MIPGTRSPNGLRTASPAARLLAKLAPTRRSAFLSSPNPSPTAIQSFDVLIIPMEVVEYNHRGSNWDFVNSVHPQSPSPGSGHLIQLRGNAPLGAIRWGRPWISIYRHGLKGCDSYLSAIASLATAEAQPIGLGFDAMDYGALKEARHHCGQTIPAILVRVQVPDS